MDELIERIRACETTAERLDVSIAMVDAITYALDSVWSQTEPTSARYAMADAAMNGCRTLGSILKMLRRDEAEATVDSRRLPPTPRGLPPTPTPAWPRAECCSLHGTELDGLGCCTDCDREAPL